MTSRFIVCGAVLLTASVAGAQEMAPQERTATAQAIVQRRAEAEQLMIAAQQGGRGVGGATFARVPLEAKIVKGAPYFAEVVTESTQVLADGNRIVRRTTGRVYRDSEGRTRHEDDLEPGRVGGVSISDPVAQVVYSLDTQSKTAWKTPIGAAGMLAGSAQMNKVSPADPAQVELRRKVEEAIVASRGAGGGVGGGIVAGSAAAEPTMRQRSPEWEEKAEVLPARNIEGVMAEGRRVTRTIPAGRIGNEQPIVSVTEEWRSPELQVLVMTRTSDPRTGESVYKLQNVTRAEPNSSWFEVPGDYTVKESGVRRIVPLIR